MRLCVHLYQTVEAFSTSIPDRKSVHRSEKHLRSHENAFLEVFYSSFTTVFFLSASAKFIIEWHGFLYIPL